MRAGVTTGRSVTSNGCAAPGVDHDPFDLGATSPGPAVPCAHMQGGDETTGVHRNVQRVVDAGAELGVVVAPRRFPEGAKTAADAAAAIGCDVGQIIKSLIFGVDGEIVLAYVSGRNRLDESKLAAAAGGERCERVDADAVRAATGFPIGGVPPLGHATRLRAFVDPALLGYDEVWGAAGTWHDVFPIAPDQLVGVTGAVVTDLAADPDDRPRERRSDRG